MASTAKHDEQRSRRREVAFAVLTIIISATICLSLAEYGYRWYLGRIQSSESIDPGLLRYHGRLGWALTPGWQGRHRHHDFEVSYSIGNDSFRVQAGEVNKPTTIRRIGIVGDSFSFGLGVNDSDIFTEIINRQSAELAVKNMSIPGYSTDQQLLLLESRRGLLKFDDVILVVYLANDLLDNMLDYPLQVDQAKPRYVLNNNKLVLTNYPVPRETKPAQLRSMTLAGVVFGDSLDSVAPRGMFSRSALWRRLVPTSPALNADETRYMLDTNLHEQKLLMQALLLEMKTLLREQGIAFHIAALSGQSLVVNPSSPSALFQDYVLEFLQGFSHDNGISFINIAKEMRSQEAGTKKRWYHPNEGHLTPSGHEKVAEILLQYLAH